MSYDRSTIARRARRTGLSVLVYRFCRGVAVRARAATFWLAVGLPWLLLGLVAGGHVTSSPAAFAGLLAVTVLCGVVGRNHGR